LTGGQVVAGSNPVTPTMNSPAFRPGYFIVGVRMRRIQ
jgi:hypothetical protein